MLKHEALVELHKTGEKHKLHRTTGKKTRHPQTYLKRVAIRISRASYVQGFKSDCGAMPKSM